MIFILVGICVQHKLWIQKQRVDSLEMFNFPIDKMNSIMCHHQGLLLLVLMNKKFWLLIITYWWGHEAKFHSLCIPLQTGSNQCITRCKELVQAFPIISFAFLRKLMRVCKTDFPLNIAICQQGNWGTKHQFSLSKIADHSVIFIFCIVW